MKIKNVFIFVLLCYITATDIYAREVSLESKIAGLYIAFFKRAPDLEGLHYWKFRGEQGASQGNTSHVLKELAAGFAGHPVFTSIYATLNNRDFVQEIYKNTLGREGDTEGINFWSDWLDNGLSRSDMVSTFVEAALASDLTLENYPNLTREELTVAQLRQNLLINKTEIALAFTSRLGTLTNMDTQQYPDLQTDPAYRASIKIISEVTEDTKTVTSAQICLDDISSSQPLEDILSNCQLSVDTTPPVVTLNGQDTVYLILGERYSEAGATAEDNRDGVIAVQISGLVDNLQPGSYTLTYTATDKAGNKTSKIRTVIVESNAPVVESGKTYYIANTGDDLNDGTSPATPWQTLTRVNQEIANKTFVPGDKILFHRGDAWSEDSTDFMLYIKELTPDSDPQYPLETDKKITFGAYGTGEDPIFSGDVEMIRIEKSSNIVIQNIQITGSNSNGSIGVSMYFDYSQAGENSDTLAVTHNNYITFDHLHIEGMAQGMVLAGKHLTVKNSTIKNTNDGTDAPASNGIWVNSGASYFTAENNIFDNNGNAGQQSHHLYISAGENGIIRNNQFIDSDPSTTAGAAVQFHAETWYSPVRNWKISGNVFADNTGMAIQLQPESDGAGDPWNQAISDIVIEKNLFKNNKYVMQLEGNNNITFQNNIVTANKNYVSFYISSELKNQGAHTVDNLVIQNNTFYNNNNNRIISWEDDGGDFIFQNNIVFEEDLTKAIIYRDKYPSTEIYRNNIYYIPNYPEAISETGSIDFGNTEPIPLFVNKGTNFQLTENSVAIDKGYANGLTEDYSGNTRPQGGGIDIGAYEAVRN